MKKIIGTIVLTLGIISSAQSDVTPKNQAGIKLVLDDIILQSSGGNRITFASETTVENILVDGGSYS